MSEASEVITCRTHGRACTTFVCQHLGADPVQRWHGAFPTPDNPWPDAWCDRCNEVFLREGAWNESNAGEVEPSVLCQYCYENAKGQSVNRLHGDRLAIWRGLVGSFQDELQEKEERLQHQFSLGRHKRWDWDQERAEIVFSNDGIAAVIASIAFVGSVSQKTGTWLWSWANSSLEPAVVGRITQVRDFGESEDYPHLVVPKWKASEVDGWEMTAVAAHVLEAEGAYRTPSENGFAYMVLSNVRFAQ